MLDIKKKIPFPEPKREYPRRKYPFEEMKVGDMFFVPRGSSRSISSYASSVGRNLDKKFATRSVLAIYTTLGWTITEDPKARKVVAGIGVWRKA